MMFAIASQVQNIDLGPELQPLADLIQPIFLKASFVFGGIFGLYVVLILVRIYYERKKTKILKDIRYDLDHLNLHYGVCSSSQKRNIFRRVKAYIEDKRYERQMKKHLKTKRRKKNKKHRKRRKK